MDPYDAYIVHASEDHAIAAALTQALQDRGLSVWFNSFRIGASIRRQMEKGLANSSVGVVILTPRLFAKRWAQEELDGLYALETDPEEPRIFPVWVGISAAEVKQKSPMMAMRHAVVSKRADTVDPEAVAQLGDEIIDRVDVKSPAQSMRAQIRRGLLWQHGPEFLVRSLHQYDDQFDDFALLSLSHHPADAPEGIAGKPAPLADFLRAPMAYDGVIITAIGRQTDGSQQVLDVHDVPLGSHEGDPVTLASHVFQLHSVDFTDYHTCYVHCLGPYHRDLTPRVPPDRLCWVTGLILAYGAVQTVDGHAANAIYIAARAMYSTPPVLHQDSTNEPT